MTSPPEKRSAFQIRYAQAFRASTPEEIAFIQERRVGEQLFPAGSTIQEEGQRSEQLYTLLAGWAFRHKTLPDGRRQILNFVLPGDMIGLQARLMEKAYHAVEALTDATVCIFSRDHLWDVFRTFPEMALDVTWNAANQVRMVDEALLSVGRRTAAERIAWLLLHIWERACRLDMVRDGALPLPVTQTHIADALGLSLVHTNRTLQSLRRSGLFELSGGVLRAVDTGGLRRLAGTWDAPAMPHPRL